MFQKTIIKAHLYIISSLSIYYSYTHAGSQININIMDNTVNWEKVITTITNPPTWWIELIEKALKPFKNENFNSEKITQQKHSFSKGELVRYTIQNNILSSKVIPDQSPQQFIHTFWKSSRLDVIENVITLLMKHNLTPSALDCIIMVGDWSHPGHNNIPVLAPVKEISNHKTILIPDAQTFTFLFQEQKTLLTAIQDPLRMWEHKKEVAIWRGISHDYYKYKNIFDSPRAKLVQISKNNPEIVNAGFSSYYKGLPAHTTFKKRFGEASFLSPTDHLAYKYLVSLDGSTAAFSAFSWRLLSNSLTIKQDSDEVQWFYPQLKPYEHYIPIKQDLSNTISTIKWLKEHDDLAHTIAQNAKHFAEENLLLEHQLAYFALVLKKYTELQTANTQL